MALLKVTGGTVYDPCNGIDDQVMDVWARDGKIVAAPTDPDARPDKVIDATGRKWTNADTEMEAGCGIVPITYKEKSFVHALQWAIGLEWYLLVKDPWQVAMTTDHPNGGSFLAYPEIVQLQMDRTYRQEVRR